MVKNYNSNWGPMLLIFERKFPQPKASDVIVEKWLKLYFKRLFHDFKRWLQWNLMLFFVDNTFIKFN